MLDLIINDESARMLFYAIAFLITTLAAEKYIEKKYNPFDDEMEMKPKDYNKTFINRTSEKR